MRKIYSLLFVIFFTNVSKAQLTGVKTIPGDYATIAAAVTALNSSGVGTGGVTFNVAAGYSESISSEINITATGTVSKPIVFQKSGSGNNPKITRTDAGSLITSTIGGQGDAILSINGTDYITFDGIDLSASNSGVEYGYLTSKPSGTDGCQNVTIKNATVTMTKGTSGYVIGIYIGNGASSVGSATGVTVTAASGINSNIIIIGNTVQNVHAGVYVRGSIATGFYDSNVVVGQSGSGNTIQNFGGGNVSSSYGVYFIYVNNPSVAYNTINQTAGGGSTHGSTLYGIFYSVVTGVVNGSNNAFTLGNSSSSSTYYIYNGNTCTTETYDNNTFTSGTFSSTGSLYLIYSSNATNTKSVSGNSISGAFTRTGAGITYMYYNLGGPTGGTETISSNNFSGVTNTGTSSTYGIYTNTTTSQNRIITNNTINSWAAGGTIYGIYCASGATNQISGNTITGIASSGTGTVYGIYATGDVSNLFSNTVGSLSGGGTALIGIVSGSTTTSNVYKNKIYNLSTSNVAPTNGQIAGIYLQSSVTINAYNNLVGDIKAPSGSNTFPISGITIGSGTTANISFNTVYLNATSSGATFGSSALLAYTSPVVNLQNNIFVNLSTPNGTTGFTSAYRRSTTTLTSYASSSNNNIFYAGVPSSNRVIFYDGTTAYQTFSSYKTLVYPRDASSFTESVPFISTSGANASFLHINPAVATQVESGAVAILGISDDFDSETRNVSTPDIGADEGDFTLLDLSPPSISYTDLPFTCNGDNRVLVATIVDPSGVPTSGTGLPVLYWKIGSGAYSSSTGTHISGSTYSFTFGSGATLGNIISYYVVAQDRASTPNIGSYPSLGAGGFTANPPSSSTPPTSPSSYIINGTLNGTYTVGSGGNYATLTAAVADYNTKCLLGPVTFNLVDASYSTSETFPIIINANPTASATNTLTIKPASGVTTSITGASTTSIIKLNGADYVIFDGSNNGTNTRSLTFVNSADGSLFWIGTDASSGATNNTLKNLILVGPGNFTGQGIIAGSGATLGNAAENGRANSYNTIQNCSVKGVQNAVFTSGHVTTLDQNWLIIQNEFGSSTTSEKLSFRGILVQNAQNLTISSNKIFGVSSSTSSSSTMSGIQLSSVINGGTVTRNFIRDIKQNNTTGWGANGVFLNSSSASAGVTLSNNMITDVAGTGYAGASSSDNGYGIMVNTGGGYNIYHNTIVLNTSQLNDGLPAAINISSSITTAGSIDVRNNIFSNTQTVGTNRYAIYSGATNTVFSNIDNNVYWSSGPNLGFIGSDRSNLAAVAAGFGGNTYSRSTAPSFISATDLHLTNGSGQNWAFESAGTPISSVASDYDGDTRSLTAPDIGADEFNASSFVVTNPAVVCAPNTIDITAAAVTAGTTSGTTFTYWTNAAGTITLTNPSAIATTGTYYIKATYGSADNYWIQPVIVTVNPLPTPSITGAAAVCEASTGNIYSVTNVAGDTYNWTVTGGTITAGQGTSSITVTWGAAGTATVTVTETITATGCAKTATLSVTLNPNPTPTISGSAAVCTTNEGYVYSVANVAGNTYAWSVGGGTITAGAGTNSITVTWGAVGAGTVTLTQTVTATGCATTVARAINIQALPTATPTVVQPITCASEDGQINLALGGATGPYTFAWTGTGNGLNATAQNQTAVSTGFYNVTVTAANGCTTSLTNVVVAGPGGCFICPTIGTISSTTTIICQDGTNTITAGGLADLGITYGIRFKYSATPLANPYLSTAGTVMGTVSNANLTVVGGTTTRTSASLTYNFPTAGTMYVYAILSPASPDPACRPFLMIPVEVAATPALTRPSNQVLCSGSASTAVNFLASPVTTTSFAWTNNQTSIGLAASGTGNISSFTATNFTNSPVTATVVVTPTNTQTLGGTTVSCPGPAQTYSYTVNPIPTVNTVANQTACAGTAVTLPFSGFVAGTVYEWTNSNSAIGLAASGSGTLSFTAANATSNPLVATIIVTPKYTNGSVTCTGNPISFTITVNPTPTVDAVSNQVLCSGSATAAVSFTGSTTGAVYSWTNTNTSIGLAASGTGDIASFTAVNTGSAPATATITVTPAYTGAGFTCTGTSRTFTVVVNPIPSVNTVASRVICNGSSNTIVLTGSATGAVYSWTNSNTAIGLAASGTGNIAFTASNTTADPISSTLTVTPSLTNGGLTCTGSTISFTIAVNPSGQVNTVSNQVLCNGSATTAVTFSTTNNGLISTGGTQTASSGPIAVAIPDATATGVTHTIPVTLPTAAVISSVSVNFDIAHTWDGDLSINLVAPNGQILNLVNRQGGSGDNFTNTTVSPAATATFASSAAPFTGTYLPDAAIGVGATGNESTAANFAALYSVPNGNWKLVIRDHAGGDVGTLNNWSLNIAYAVQGAFGTNMNWTNSLPSIGLAASGTGNIPSFTATNTGAAAAVATVTVTPSYFNNGTSCPGTPITYTYTVNPTPTVNAIANQTFCAGTPSTVSITGATTGTVYSWTNSNTAIGLAASGTGNLSFTPTNTGTTPITATITVTPSYTNAGVTCTGTPRTFTITVNPVGQVNTVSSQVLCNGANTTAVTFSSVNSGGSAVSPGTQTASSGTIAVAIPDANAAGVTHAIPVTLPAGATVTGVSVNFNVTHTWDSDLGINLVAPNGQILNLVNRQGGSGDNFTNTTVSPNATATFASGVAPFTGTFLPDAAAGVGPTSYTSAAANFAALYSVGSGNWMLAIRDYAGGDVGTLTGWSITINYTTVIPAVTTYAWTNNTTSVGLAASGTGNIASFVATNTGAAPVTATVTVTPTFTNAGTGCVGTPITYTYTVNPTPTVNTVANQTVCKGSNVAAVTFSGATTGTVYNWTNTNTAIGLAASGTGNIATFVGTNTTSAPITGTVTVTPSYTNGGVTCVGTPKTFTITVNPIPTVNAVASFPVCHNLPVAVNFTGATTGTVYSWTNTNPAIGLAASGTGNLSFTATNPTTGGAPISGTITVTPSYTNNGTTCVGTPITFTITVNPLPIVSAGTLPSMICISDTLVKLNGTPAGGSWSGNGTSGTYFVPPSTAVGSYVLTYRFADINGCVNSASITANVLACEERNRDLNSGAVVLYPNPNSGQFNLRVNSTRFNILGMKVYNAIGQLVSVKQWSGLVYGRVIPVNLSNLPADVYMVRLYYGDGMDRGADKTYQMIIAH